MTERQAKHLYWPAWGRAFRRNWAMERGRLSRLPDATNSEWMDAVVVNALALARRHHRAPIADDLRHACHAVACGRAISSKDLNNAQVDRVLTLFALLEDPDNLDAVMRWQNPQLDAERRVDWAITHTAPEAYVRQIAGDKYGTRMWEWLDIGQKRNLLMTLKNRQAKWNVPVKDGFPCAGQVASRREATHLDQEVDAGNAPF